MEREDVWREFEKLPPDRQEEAANFIRFLASQEPVKLSRPRARRKKKISEDPCIGMWKDREDMKDSAKWLREMRLAEWGG